MRVLAGVVVLIAGTVPVVLFAGGDDPGTALIHWPRPVAGLAPGSAIGGPTEGAGQSPTSGATVGAGQAVGGARAKSEPEYSQSSVVVSLLDPANSAAITSRGATIVGEIAGTGFIRVRPAGDPTALVAELQRDPAVAAAALDYGRRTSRVPNDEFYAQYQQAYLNLVRMPVAWDLLTDATSQVVAVVDTGVDAGHPDLTGRLVGGFNAVAPGSAPSDEAGHGTFVAGVIAANTSNGTGVAGVTWNGRVMPVKVFAGPLAFDSDIASGIVWAVDHGARVVNLSLGGPGESPLLQAAVRYATDRNIVVVAASGNDGNDTPQYPAAFPEVVAVGATDAAGKLVDFSSYGEWLDLAAPGFDVVSTAPGNNYAIGDGTSFAAPIVAGVAAMVRAQNPALTQAQVGDRLRAAARDAGPRGHDPYYGFGILDAARALGAPFAADLAFPALGAGESNDVPDRATPITLGASRAAGIGVEGDSDWYRLESESPQVLRVAVDTPTFNPISGQNLDPVLEVFNTDLGRIAMADSPDPTADESAEVLVLSGPTYIRVHNYNGAADPNTYQLTVTVAGPSPEYDVDIVQTGTGPDAVAIGDVTGDGSADLVYVTRQAFSQHPDDNKVFVRAQQPDGTLGAPVPYVPAQATLQSLTLADVDQDGRLDLIAADGGIEWFRQDETGALVSQGLLIDIGDVRFVTSADLDGDDDADLVAIVRTNGSGFLTVLTHESGSSFTASSIPNAGPRLNPIDVSAGDVDGDGRADVVHAPFSFIRVHHNEASGWTHTEHMGVSPQVLSLTMVAVADLTGDGLADIVATNMANSPSGVINVFRQNIDHTLAAPVMYDAGDIPQAVEAGDVNGDGRIDVALINNGHGSVTIFHQRPDGTLGNRVMLPVGFMQHPNGQGLAIGDLDGDGLNDIAAVGDTAMTIIRHLEVVGPAPDQRHVVRSVSPVEYSTGATVGTAPHVVFAADVSGSTVDGDTVRLVDGRTGAAVAAAVSYDAGSRTATITPNAPLHRAKPYRIVVDGVQAGSGLPVLPFASTFTTGAGSLLPLQDFAVRGQVGTAASVSAVVPVGDLGEVIVRYALGTTPPGSPTTGSAGYTGVGGGIMIGGLTPGQTYSFSVWYRDRNGNQSSPSIATLVGTTLTMTGTSTSTGPGTVAVTFGGTVATPAGPGAGLLVPLVAYCADGPFGAATVATATGNASGSLSVTLTLGAPRCSYRWEITNSTLYMGASTTAVRVTDGPILPPGQNLPRDR